MENAIRYGVTTDIKGADTNRPELEITERNTNVEVEVDVQAQVTQTRSPSRHLILLY